MHRLAVKLSNRKGFTLILSALLIFVFIGAAAMAVDVGHIQMRRAELHAAADAAALAGIEKFAASNDPDQALAEAQLFAGKFKADATTLTLAAGDFALGNWDATQSPPFSTGRSPTNAAQATIRYTGPLTFAPVLFGHISQHAGSATSVAIGVPSKSVTASTCVAPVVLSFGDLLAQLGLPANTTTLTQDDINKLMSATAADAITLDIPNGTQVSSLSNGEFYQVELPPVLTADGTTQTGQSPSAADFKNAFTCTGGNPGVGVGDWLAILNGQDANQAKQGMNNAGGGTYPATIEVALTGAFSNTISPACASSGAIKGCLQVLYLGAFTVTQEPGGKGVTGYFTALDPKAGGVTGTGTAPGPLALVKTRLVF
jgi:Flp pilus assembly protein TadG